ncbi:MAG: sodium:proton antiporter NhaD [Bacteroidia bacterium]|nr:sodium:proton antiporter NhaD [Bacteroidia bacterium]
MELLIAVFVIGYLFIALEHNVKIDKAATAITLGAVSWVIISLSGILPQEKLGDSLAHHLSEISAILFFLIGAMTIVEIIDSYEGFRIITDKIKTRNKTTLLWLVSGVTFFLSAVLDNLTTTILMVSIARKLVQEDNERKTLVGMIVIAANAGGAFSPIGDVTTTMLWVGGQVSSLELIKHCFLPSIICLVVPLIILSFSMKGTLAEPTPNTTDESAVKSDVRILILGITGLILVPVLKTVFHLPPFMGMILSLGTIWIITEWMHRKKTDEEKTNLAVARILKTIDTPSVLFFLGILLAVAALSEAGILAGLAKSLDKTIGNNAIVAIIIGLASAVVDNVPLVAATMRMYSLVDFPIDHFMWQMIAFCAGTGGSVLIIGSAAGVAAMGIEKIPFGWYFKKIGTLALVGYFAGVAVLLLQHNIS